MIQDAVLILIIGYLVGSFPTAILAGKLLRNMDIREHGSGNAGATNVLRVLGWKTALIVLLIDMFKGFVPVFWIAGMIHGQTDTLIFIQILAAVGAIIGHVWTVFAGFKGGKGVGTSAGVFLGLAPVPLVIALIFFTLVVSLSRYVSLGSILSALVFLLVMLLQKYVFLVNVPDVLLYLTVIIVLLIWVLHGANIRRLMNGTENKISFSGQKDRA
jgi:glycerol-3-phosphate acyltransferase PlsY